jgi:hypothetical protein
LFLAYGYFSSVFHVLSWVRWASIDKSLVTLHELFVSLARCSTQVTAFRSAKLTEVQDPQVLR